MKKKVSIDSISKHPGQTVTVTGWVHKMTDIGKLVFIILRDGTGYIQCVFKSSDTSSEEIKIAGNILRESSISITGIVKSDKRAIGNHELSDCCINIIHESLESYPLSKKKHGSEFLLNNRHLSIRSQKMLAIMKIRDTLILSAKFFLKKEKFICVDTPLITPAACESTMGLFKVDYYNNTAFLSQSGQLYLEAAIASYTKVYCLGPVFRAEKRKSKRHLTEFWMLEPEMAHITLEENMEFQERLLKQLIKDLIDENSNELLMLGQKIEYLKGIKFPIQKITYSEAIDMLKNTEYQIDWGKKISFKAEKFISCQIGQPFFIYLHPMWQKAFYMKPDSDYSKCVLSCDLIAPDGYGEISGGGQRIDDYVTLKQSLLDNELPATAFQWFLDLRKFGSVPHGGFGMGIERTLSWICGLDHIRDAILFPRMINRISP